MRSTRLLALSASIALLGAPAAADTRCESAGSYRECRVGPGGKVLLVMDTSQGRLCQQNVTWGTARSGVVWVDGGCRGLFATEASPTPGPAAPQKPQAATLECPSTGTERRWCEADTALGVALVRLSGQGRCVLDETWGFDARGVWVSGGCGGTFALGGFRLDEGAVPKTALRLRCEPPSTALHRCPVDGVRGAGLVRQVSQADCILNRTWGYDRDGLWVTGGCAADFAVVR